MKMKPKIIQILPFPLLAAACASNPDLPEASPPNIVVIVSDDHGQDDLGSYGNKAIYTPNLDALAAEGIRFTNAYCTSASCSASRSVILTGLYNHATGQYGHEHRIHHFSTFETIRTLPVILSENGYRTARVGKFHVGPEEVYLFDKTIQAGGRNPHQMAVNSREFLTENRNRPFFLYFCTDDPHRGGGVVEDDPLKPDRFGNREQGYEGITERFFTPDEVEVPWYLPDTRATRAELAQYYQSVARMDQGIGKLFEILKEEGLWENTLVMYLTDNGIAFHGAKTNVYDPAIRLPLIVKMPGGSHSGSVTNAMVNWADLTPTILDLVGVLDGELEKRAEMAEKAGQTDPPGFANIPVFSRFHGRSFLPVLKDPWVEGFDEIFASHTFHEITMYYPMRVVENRDFKLIWNIASGLAYPHSSDLWASASWQYLMNTEAEYHGKRRVADYLKRPPFELFNIANDPYETTNLAYDPDYADVLFELKEKLKDFQISTNDPWANKWVHE